MRFYSRAMLSTAALGALLGCTGPIEPEPGVRMGDQAALADAHVGSATQRATGGVVTQAAPGITVDVQFNAHGPAPVYGRVNYTNSLGEFFRGEVDLCYVQVGSTAVFAGTMDEGSGTFAGQYFRIEVHDNGEGQDSPPDLMSVGSFAEPPPCVFTGLFLNPVIRGNLQVHTP